MANPGVRALRALRESLDAYAPAPQAPPVLAPVHAVTVVLSPDRGTEQLRVVAHADPMPVEHVVGCLRAAAARLAQQHALNGADCLADFLTAYPQPDIEGNPHA